MVYRPWSTASLMCVLLLLDQGTKIWVRATIPLHRTTGFIPYLIDLTHVENPGVSFSFLGDLADAIRVPLLVTVSLAAALLLGWYWLRHRRAMHSFMDLAFIFILPGAVGNLIDRALYGRVTDFLHFRFGSTSFFVNNLADIFISMGVVAYALGILLSRRSHPESEEA